MSLAIVGAGQRADWWAEKCVNDLWLRTAPLGQTLQSTHLPHFSPCVHFPTCRTSRPSIPWSKWAYCSRNKPNQILSLTKGRRKIRKTEYNKWVFEELSLSTFPNSALTPCIPSPTTPLLPSTAVAPPLPLQAQKYTICTLKHRNKKKHKI